MIQSRYLAIAILASTLMACQHSVEGAKEDLREDSINASKKIQAGIDDAPNLAKNAEQAGKNLIASQLTLRVKNAINADSALNSPGNVIDVDTTKSEVSLNGHVISSSLKEKATNVAREEMKKAHANQILTNNLKVEDVHKSS